MTDTNSITLMTQQYHTNDSKIIILMTETNDIIVGSYSIVLKTQRKSNILMTQRNSIILMTETKIITLMTQQYHTNDSKSIILMTETLSHY